MFVNIFQTFKNMSLIILIHGGRRDPEKLSSVNNKRKSHLPYKAGCACFSGPEFSISVTFLRVET